MFNVVLALLPVCGYAVYAFGLAALLVLLTAVLSCVLTEHLLCRLRGTRDDRGRLVGRHHGHAVRADPAAESAAVDGCRRVA